MSETKVFLAGLMIGAISAIFIIGILAGGVRFILESVEDITEAIDDHKMWKARRNILRNSFDLADIKDWLERDDVRNFITSKEFGLWLRHYVISAIEREKENRIKEKDGAE